MFEKPPNQLDSTAPKAFKDIWGQYLDSNHEKTDFRRIAELLQELDSFDVTENFRADGLRLISLLSSFHTWDPQGEPTQQDIAKELYIILDTIEDEMAGGAQYCPAGLERAYEDEIYPLARKLINLVLDYYEVSESDFKNY